MNQAHADFLNKSKSEIRDLVRYRDYPRLGVFVPDGSRRLIRAFTNATPSTEDFYRLCATLPAEHLLAALQTCFAHGLPTLLVPILSASVLKRGGD